METLDPNLTAYREYLNNQLQAWKARMEEDIVRNEEEKVERFVHELLDRGQVHRADQIWATYRDYRRRKDSLRKENV